MAKHDEILRGEFPETWEEYVGQEAAKRRLQIAAQSARALGENMGHFLISAPWAGHGKTALGILAARTLDRPVHLITGKMTLPEARILLSQVRDGDIILWDEFHKAAEGGKKNIEWMLHYLENGVLVTNLGQEPAPDVTFICATTDKGLLPDSILQRFEVLDLVAYTDEQGADIAGVLSTKVMGPAGLPPVCDETADQIARAGSNQPRLMRKLLKALRDLAVTKQIPDPLDGKYEMDEALHFNGLTPDGLNVEARRYLVIMIRELRAEPAGAALMKERMGLVGTGLPMVERLLLDKGLIAKTKAGRMLTGEGIRRAQEIAAAEEGA